jgi:hypothetical protein
MIPAPNPHSGRAFVDQRARYGFVPGLEHLELRIGINAIDATVTENVPARLEDFAQPGGKRRFSSLQDAALWQACLSPQASRVGKFDCACRIRAARTRCPRSAPPFAEGDA